MYTCNISMRSASNYDVKSYLAIPDATANLVVFALHNILHFLEDCVQLIAHLSLDLLADGGQQLAKTLQLLLFQFIDQVVHTENHYLACKHLQLVKLT